MYKYSKICTFVYFKQSLNGNSLWGRKKVVTTTKKDDFVAWNRHHVPRHPLKFFLWNHSDNCQQSQYNNCIMLTLMFVSWTLSFLGHYCFLKAASRWTKSLSRTSWDLNKATFIHWRSIFPVYPSHYFQK